MNEKKPRPEYGEYATPQDQARAMGLSYGDTGIADASKSDTSKPADVARQGDKPAEKSATKPVKQQTPDKPERKRQEPVMADDQGERPVRTWDAVLTVVLIVIGVSAVLVSIPGFADLFDVINAAYTQLDRGPYTSRELAENIGFAINAGQIAILVVTIALSVRALRTGRIAFYIPLLGGVATLLLMMILLGVATVGDPAFMDSVPS